MKRYVLAISICILIISNIYGQSNAIKVLINSYKPGFITKGKDSVYYRKVFFNIFPSNFKSFKKIFYSNYINNFSGQSYDDLTLEPINHFFSLKCINKDTLTTKIINIAIDGTWDADAIGYFQMNLKQYVISQNKEFIKTLETYSDGEIASVWAFYFDYENSFIRKNEYSKLIKLISPENKAMLRLITKGYIKSSKWRDNN